MTTNVKYDLNLDFDDEANTVTLTVNGVSSQAVSLDGLEGNSAQVFRDALIDAYDHYPKALNNQTNEQNLEIANSLAEGIQGEIALNNFLATLGKSGKFGDIRKFALTLDEQGWGKFVDFAVTAVAAGHPFAGVLGILSPVDFENPEHVQELYNDKRYNDEDIEGGTFWEAFDDQNITIPMPEVFIAENVSNKLTEFMVQRVIELISND